MLGYSVLHLAVVAGTACGAFFLGYAAHVYGLQDLIRPYVIYLLRRNGGCPLAVARTYRNARLLQASTEIYTSSKLLKATPDGLELWQTKRGLYWVPSTIMSFFNILAEQEIGIYGAAEFRVQPGEVVLDCGANVGVFTREALMAGAGLVVAVEPVPIKTECLRRSFEREIADGKVVLCERGMWSEKTTLEMSIYKDTVMDSFVLKDRTREVLDHLWLPVTTIDDLVEELGLERVDFIKMDVEGATCQVIMGAQATLGKFRPRLAIATEDTLDDYLLVPPLVRQAWPGYQWSVGACRLEGSFQIVPDVLHFRPA
jgi:FkbM family methyltransferase